MPPSPMDAGWLVPTNYEPRADEEALQQSSITATGNGTPLTAENCSRVSDYQGGISTTVS